LVGDRPIVDIFASRSPSAKKLGVSPADLPEDEMVRLMLEEPRLIRRPLTKVGDKLVVGSREADLQQALG
jgi:arsenate reductase-like glutaredoxin family protein